MRFAAMTLVLGSGASGATTLVSGPGVEITDVDVRDEIAFQPDLARARYTKDLAALKSLIDNLYRRDRIVAVAEGLDLTEPEHYRLERARKETLVAIAVDRKGNELLAKAPDFTVRAAEQYASHKDKFALPEQVCVRHILIAAKDPQGNPTGSEKAKQILEQIRAGADFAEVATRESADTSSAARGGSIGCIPRGKTVPPFEQAAFGLSQPGDISGIVETQFGFHIIRLDERKAPRTPSFDEVRDRLVRSARADWLKAELQRWRTGLTDPAEAKVDADAINAFLKSVLQVDPPKDEANQQKGP